MHPIYLAIHPSLPKFPSKGLKLGPHATGGALQVGSYWAREQSDVLCRCLKMSKSQNPGFKMAKGLQQRTHRPFTLWGNGIWEMPQVTLLSSPLSQSLHLRDEHFTSPLSIGLLRRCVLIAGGLGGKEKRPRESWSKLLTQCCVGRTLRRERLKCLSQSDLKIFTY